MQIALDLDDGLEGLDRLQAGGQKRLLQARLVKGPSAILAKDFELRVGQLGPQRLRISTRFCRERGKRFRHQLAQLILSDARPPLHLQPNRLRDLIGVLKRNPVLCQGVDQDPAHEGTMCIPIRDTDSRESRRRLVPFRIIFVSIIAPSAKLGVMKRTLGREPGETLPGCRSLA